MPSKDRIMVNFSNKGIHQRIVELKKSSTKSLSKIVEEFVIEGMASRERGTSFLPEQQYCDTKEKSPWLYYRRELGMAQSREVLERIYTRSFSILSPILDLKEKKGRYLVDKKVIQIEILKWLKNECGYQTIVGSAESGPNSLFHFVLNADVAYSGKKDKDSLPSLIITVRYVSVPAKYNKDYSDGYHLDMNKVAYYSYKNISTRKWNNKKYSHFIPVGVNMNIWRDDRHGTYFVGVLHSPMSYAQITEEQEKMKNEMPDDEKYIVEFGGVTHRFIIDPYVIKIREGTFPTKVKMEEELNSSNLGVVKLDKK
jgi:hypothetical protein